ncbi:hypothetical protein, partial [Halomonas sp. ALS9]
GASTAEESNTPRWQALDETLRSDPERIVLSDASGLYYVFANPVSASPGDTSASNSPKGDTAARWPLIEERDRNGYTTQYRWEGDQL